MKILLLYELERRQIQLHFILYNLFFFEEIKMEYINKGDVISSVQNVPPRTPLPTKSHTRYIQD